MVGKGTTGGQADRVVGMAVSGAVCGIALLSSAVLGCSGKIETASESEPVIPATEVPATNNPVPVGPEQQPPAGVTPDGLIDSPEAVLESTSCDVPQPGAAPLRRLSNFEYRNSIEDLVANVALADQAAGGFVQENESLGFRNSASLLVVSSLVAQQYMDAAEAVATESSQQPTFVTCANPADARGCAQEFIRSFGKSVYRRPLSVEEEQRYLALYDEAVPLGDNSTGIEWIVFTMLQSPHFLYRVEKGEVTTSGAPMQPTALERAARLSFLLWQSTPDAALLALAESGQLSTPEQVAAQARTMLQDPRADRVYEFFDQWLDVDRIAAMQRDPAVFPGLETDLPALFREETRSFVLDLLHSPTPSPSGGTLGELLTAPYTFVNARLAAHYGISGPAGEDFSRVDRADSVGFFSQGGFIAAQDKPTRSSIVRRGLKVRTDLLCQLVPAPPNDVQIDLEGFAPELSQRERLALHRENPACASCHELLDPMGLVLETYDAVGRPRTVDEQGNPIDSSSVITRTRDLDGPVSGAAELAARMAVSDEVRQCYTTQSFRFFYGRDATADDVCSRAQLSQVFRDSNYDLSELLIALTQTDAFLYRPAIVAASN